MKSIAVRILAICGLIIGLPLAGYAQETTLSGTVTDSTGGVLPGVTIVAGHEATGNTFEGVTDERGTYRLPVRPGVFRVTASLAGFASVTRTGLELLLSQQAVVNIQLSPSAVQETVTVTGEAPLIDVTRSAPSGNIDPRQMQQLPINGRNWMDLTLLAPGSRANATTADSPVEVTASNGVRMSGDFQLNIDGQQVTNNAALGGLWVNPRFSRDAIAEFQFIANRFDATLGRAGTSQVNAITKSGTNTFAGTFSGYFRDDALNAKDHVTNRVLPYSNQQLTATYGGPIRRDRIHFFANYEFEREPSTIVYTSPFPSFNIDQQTTRKEHKGGGRVDMQFKPQLRLAVRAFVWDSFTPVIGFGAAPGTFGEGGGTRHPSSAQSTKLQSQQILGTLTQVLGNNAVNEVRVGYSNSRRVTDVTTRMLPWADHPLKDAGYTLGSPVINVLGYSIGGMSITDINQEGPSIRDDFTFSFQKGGRHDVKTGGEYYWVLTPYFVGNRAVVTIDATAGPRPANLEALFPVWNDVSTWNIAALSSITRSWSGGIGNYRVPVDRDMYAFWFQDDWRLSDRLTLNLGLRYDLMRGTYAEDIVFEPFLHPGRKDDTNNIGPRIGAAYSLDDRTVVRVGVGKYFGDVATVTDFGPKLFTQSATFTILNDGRPDFAANPFNGPRPTFEQVQQRLCSVAQRPGCIRLNLASFPMNDMQIPYSYQASAGVQRQLGESMAVEADYVYNGGRAELFVRNTNLSYNPATGANYPFIDISRRPFPDWGIVGQWTSEGWSNYHSLQAALHKRFSRRWQGSATYLLAKLSNSDSAPDVGFPVAPDVGEDYAEAPTSQRHRVVLNGIWEMKYGFQLSGLYFFGSGAHFLTRYGGDLRLIGTAQSGTGRLRPDGTIVPRTNFVGKPIHRVDVRLQRRFSLTSRVQIDGIAEVFNLFNHANYGIYTTDESNPRYGRPSQLANVAYQPRVAQFGFRAAF